MSEDFKELRSKLSLVDLKLKEVSFLPLLDLNLSQLLPARSVGVLFHFHYTCMQK